MINAVYLALLSILGFIVAYFVYGRFIASKILGLDPAAQTPAYLKQDQQEYVPTNKFVLFGHHFASIAGLGPILGPAIAVIWGWLPAILWVIAGTIFIGAVHDLVALGLSLKFEGRGIGDLARDIVGPRARLLALLIIFFLLAMVMGVFVLIIAMLFTNFQPQAVIPTMALIVIAVIIGLLVYKYRLSLALATVIGLVAMFAMLLLGIEYPVALYPYFTSSQTRALLAQQAPAADCARYCYVVDPGASALKHDQVYRYQDVQTINATLKQSRQALVRYRPIARYDVKSLVLYLQYKGSAKSNALLIKNLQRANRQAADGWRVTLLLYTLIASVLPVWLLLQPRDYLNSFQLYIGGGLMYLGLFLGWPLVVAPAVNAHVHLFTTDSTSNIPGIFPFLFITVACGAISGFHGLVSSGTTVRQLRKTRDAVFVGYGGMLLEGALAVVVILACTAAFDSQESWSYYYRNWGAAKGLQAKMAAFINGAAVFITNLGVSFGLAKTFITVVVVGFAMTTLDSGTRLLRYNLEEIGHHIHCKALRNRYLASLLAVLAIAFFAFMQVKGKPAGITLWALFGTTNQLMAVITLLIATVYLYKNRRPVLYTLLPMLFMLMITISAMIINWLSFWQQGNLPLLTVGGTLIIMAVWLCLEGILALRHFARARHGSGTE